MAFLTDMHNQEIEKLRATARMEELKAATALAEAQRDQAHAELVRAREPTNIAEVNAELDKVRLVHEDRAEARMFWLKLAMILGGAAALCTLFASMAVGLP
jgi:multidrug resistance efflux pump